MKQTPKIAIPIAASALLTLLAGCGSTSGGGYGYDSGQSDTSWYPRLVGASSDGAASQLRTNGYRRVDSFASGSNGEGSVWYSDANGQCLQVITVDGRVDSSVDIRTHPRCR